MQNKMMMKLTIGSEAIFFMSLMVSYLYFWRSGNFQTAAADYLHIKTTGLFTLCLFSSSFTFFQAERSFIRRQFKSTVAWLSGTVLLGLVFLAGQGHEYYNLIKKDLSISKSEFGSNFFTLTGFHGLHVLVGVILLSVVLLLLIRGSGKLIPDNAFKTIGMYWHFVDAVWLFVFTLIYVLPYLL